MQKGQFWRGLVWCVKLGIIVTGVVMLILFISWGRPDSKIWGCVATVGLAVVPDLFRLVGINASKKLELTYLLFLIPALILGIDLDLYKIWPISDKISHLLSGVLAATAANEILNHTYRPLGGKDWRFRLLTIMSFVALTAVGWECFEFLHDIIFDGHMQELISTGLDDTMWDMIWALGGGFVGALALLFAPWDAARVH